MRNQVTRHNTIHGILSCQILPATLGGGGKALLFSASQADSDNKYKYINERITPTATRHTPYSGGSFLCYIIHLLTNSKQGGTL